MFLGMHITGFLTVSKPPTTPLAPTAHTDKSRGHDACDACAANAREEWNSSRRYKGMEFFENQVGEVRFLTTLPDPPAAATVVPPITPRTSSPTATATIANVGHGGSLAVDAPSNHNASPSTAQRTQPRQGINKPDKKTTKKKQPPLRRATRHSNIVRNAIRIRFNAGGAHTGFGYWCKAENPRRRRRRRRWRLAERP